MSNLQKFLAIILALGAIFGAVWRFDSCKVAKAEFKAYVADTDVFKLETYRRALQQRIWDIKREFPNTYQNMREYLNLLDELRALDVKISAHYQKKGKP